MTKVYIVHRDAPIPEAYASKLSAWRHDVYNRLRNDKARRESLTAGLLFGYMLAENGMDAKTANVSLLPAGKPVFTENRGLNFSLSHSGLWAMCALSDNTVGVDIQEQRPVKHTLSRRLHPEEDLYLNGLSDEDWANEFFRLWTRKEAWVKAYSRDEMLSLQEYSVLSDHTDFWFTDYKPKDSIYAAVCTSQCEIPEILSVSIDQLLQI